MPPNGYTITEPLPGFAVGDVLNVTRQYRHWHHNRLELEHIDATPGAGTVVVVDELTGFSEADILDPTARLGDWHAHDLTFDAAGTTVTTTADGAPTHLTMDTLTRVADPMSG